MKVDGEYEVPIQQMLRDIKTLLLLLEMAEIKSGAIEDIYNRWFGRTER